ncbi:MAG: GNAT family N-acetyltransferase [Anaerolineae bacterium]|nr:GNAT family N-acetyltransferase [Anaerolineae bacterium]
MPSLTWSLSHDPRDLLVLEAEWNTILDRASRRSIFLTWDWAALWWEAFGTGRELWLYRFNAGDSPVAVVPLVRTKHTLGPLHWHSLELIGTPEHTGDPDHVDLVALPEFAIAVADSLVIALQETTEQWDLLDLNGLHPESSLRNAVQALGVRVIENPDPDEPGSACAYFDLPPAWEIYERDILTHKKYREIAKYGRRLERELGGRYHFGEIDTPERLHRVVEAVIANDRAYSEEHGTRAAFDREENASFYRAIMQRAFERGWLHSCVIDIDGKIAAWVCDFRFGDTLYGYRIGYDPQWRHYAVGRQVITRAIQIAIERGYRRYELGRGESYHKDVWAADEVTDVNVRVLASPAAQRTMDSLATARSVWHGVKGILPRNVRRALKGQALRTPAVDEDIPGE